MCRSSAGQAHLARATRWPAVRLRYRVYANELTVRTSHLDGTHGYFNGATLFLYSEGLRDSPQHLTVDPSPAGARSPRWSGPTARWQAPSYDELVDSPFEVGPHTPLRFRRGRAA